MLARLFCLCPDKLNMGARGNIVSQFHVAALTTAGPAWPGLVWGSKAAVPHGEGELEEVRERLAAAFREG